MTEATHDAQRWLARWAGEPYAYLTTTGRRSGRPHRIEIWFGVWEGQMYLLAGSRERADWVRNLQAHAKITVELGDETHVGTARVLAAGTVEDRRARELLVAKYQEGDNLDEWGRTALPVAIAFPTEGEPAADAGSSSRGGQAAVG
ncbi:MAG TPA: nitroreductase family deazaflavin-dependent oxidoreductase [Thermomicrobiales bacterium]|jgi:deazaflavin-dependent oxidoreductase (nitroreductase family)